MGDTDEDKGPAVRPTFSAVSAGTSHNCAVTTRGNIECIGERLHGNFNDGLSWTPNEQSGGGTFVAVSAGGAITAGLTSGSTIEMIGRDLQHYPRQPWAPTTTLHTWTRGACKMANGTVAESITTHEGCKAVSVDVFTAVSTGSSHACGLSSGGAIECGGVTNYQEDQKSPIPAYWTPPLGTATRLSL